MLMNAEQSCLLIVDVQERLAPAMSDPARVIRHCGILLQAANRLSIPVVVSEQYPKGLGPTVQDLQPLLPPEGAAAKMQFSCAADPEILRRLHASQRKQIIIAGIESHVCVLQTAIGLKEKGFNVFVVEDASASRMPANEVLAADRMRQENIALASTEMAIFEWLGKAGTLEFKELSALIR